MKKVTLDAHETVLLLSLTLCFPEKYIWDAYASSVQLRRLPPSKLYEILKAVSNGNQRLLTAVYYIIDILVNDSVNALVRIFRTRRRETVLAKLIECNACCFPHYIVKKIKAVVVRCVGSDEASKTDATNVLSEISENFSLLSGHLLRIANQQ
eukprot:IDg11449t1